LPGIEVWMALALAHGLLRSGRSPAARIAYAGEDAFDGMRGPRPPDPFTDR
jgi:hypothetical protein